MRAVIMDSAGKSGVDITVLAPVFNESENIGRFHDELKAVLDGLGRSYEVIYIDDGSTDGSGAALKQLAAGDDRLRVITFTRNFGQTAAISAGINCARGDVLIPIDTDLQNDPRDIPRLLEKIDEGYDVVSGWRRDRKDPFFSKKLPSSIANTIISLIGGLKLHDYGCSLKAYRRDVIKPVRLYGEMHRFMPLYAHRIGAKTTEIPVNHRPRKAGRSNYGLVRIYKVMLDLITVKFLGTYSTKPIYLFGSVGLFFGAAGAFFGFDTLFDMYKGVMAHRNPKLLISVFFLLLGFQFIMLGLIAELLIRIYYESQNKEPYFIREKTNFPPE